MRQIFFLSMAEGYGDGTWQPPADIYQINDEWVVKLDLAGVRPRDIEILAKGATLTIQGIRRDTLLQQGCHLYSLEIPYNRFRKFITFPLDLSRAHITFEYNYGMLLIRVTPEGGE